MNSVPKSTRPAGPDVIVVDKLVKRFGTTTALDGIDLRVPSGIVYGLLGPNGCGKTTTVRILATLSSVDGGRAEVCGFDVTRDPDEVRSRIGLVGQQAALDERLPARLNLIMFGRLYHLGERGAKKRADELIERFGLGSAANRLVSTYSGGMRRRLDLAASLIISPQLLFLDEPTTGLDPRGRSEVWAAIKELTDGGTTVLLTTQYLDEADQLAQRVAVIDQGRVLAEGTPSDLKRSVGTDRLEIVVTDPAAVDMVVQHLRAANLSPDADWENGVVSVPIIDGLSDLSSAIAGLKDSGVPIGDISLRRSSLDDVFLSLTGHATEDTEERVAS
ncbi:MAG: ATP-binding cassette domain-containing protein [Acidimicrobiales bacterium]